MKSVLEDNPSKYGCNKTQNVKRHQDIDLSILPQTIFLVTSSESSNNPPHYPDLRQNHFKLNFRDKLKALKKKREAINGIIKRIEKGPHRIMRKYLKPRKVTSNFQEEENESEQVESDCQGQRSVSHNLSTLTHASNLHEERRLIQNQTSSIKMNQKEIMQQSFAIIQGPTKEKIFNEPIKQETKVAFKLLRNNQGWKYFKPEFTLLTEDGEKELVFCKKIAPLTFILSRNKTNFEESSAFYMGKLVSNLSGSLLNLYIRMFNQISNKDEEKLICSIEYANSYLEFSKPRFIRVYLDNYYGKKFDHSGKSYDSVKEMYEKEEDQSAISVFESRKPAYHKETKTYSLDFYGRADISSIKNFILEDIHHRGRDYLLFGKTKQNQYNLDVMSPFTPLIAFSICLSSFNGKLICE